MRKTYYQGKPGTPAENVTFVRPDCEVCGKSHSAVFNSTYHGDGSPYFRRLEQNNDCENSGKIGCRVCLKNSRLNANKYWALGKDSQGQGGYKFHRLFVKGYCENVDSRLGFTCTTSFPENFDVRQMLDVDHVDENHDNNHPSNLQTLCASCHRYKTAIERSSSKEHVTLVESMIKKHHESFNVASNKQEMLDLWSTLPEAKKLKDSDCG